MGKDNKGRQTMIIDFSRRKEYGTLDAAIDKQKKFILLKGKVKNGDEYFNPSHMLSFDIYEDDNGNKFLNICFPSNKVRQFSEKAYEIEDFVERLKALEYD
jgi:hypothetical protein